MEMTNSEIITSYRDSLHKSQQIRILAELNAVSTDAIMDILRESGDLPKKEENTKVIPRRGRPKKEENTKVIPRRGRKPKTESAAGQKKEMPAAVQRLVGKALDELEEAMMNIQRQREALEEKYNELESEYKEIVEYMKGA